VSARSAYFNCLAVSRKALSELDKYIVSDYIYLTMVENGIGLKEHLSSGDYTFLDGVFFVSGAQRGAIYDTNSRRVFSVNESACKILPGMSENSEFWRKLEPLGLVTNEKIEPKSALPELLQEPSLQFLYIPAAKKPMT